MMVNVVCMRRHTYTLFAVSLFAQENSITVWPIDLCCSIRERTSCN
jgi:hypothetical protein